MKLSDIENESEIVCKLRRNKMWPYKKDKGVTLPPGKSFEIGFDVEWRKDKDEVVIITDSGRFVLDGKNALFLEVTSSNAEPIRVQIIPDFRKKVINIVEVIDANAKPVTCDYKGRISLAGVGTSKDNTISIGELLKRWDEDICTHGKRMHKHKMRRNVLMVFAAIVAIGNVYIFTIGNTPIRYINVAITVIIMYTSFRLWNSYRDLNREYEKYKELRSHALEVAKNK